MLGPGDPPNTCLLITQLSSKFTFSHTCVEFPSKQETANSQKKHPMISPTRTGHPPSIRGNLERVTLQHCRERRAECAPKQTREQEEAASSGSYFIHRNLRNRCLHTKKEKCGCLSSPPCHAGLGYVRRSPSSKLEHASSSLWQGSRTAAPRRRCWREDPAFARSGTREFHFLLRE